MKRWIIEKLGGYPDVDSAIDAIKETNVMAREEILTMAVKRLFNTITEEDILRENASGQWIFAGQILTVGQVKAIKAEFESLVNMSAWKILQTDIKYRVNKKMFLDSRSELDLTIGKLWLLTLNIFNTRINSAIKGTGHFNIEKK